MQELTQLGVAALKAGNRKEAYRYLSQAVKNNPKDTYAWLWLSGASDNDEERVQCLREVLRIDPGNQAASRGLDRLLTRSQITQWPEKSTKPSGAGENIETDQELTDELHRNEPDLPEQQGGLILGDIAKRRLLAQHNDTTQRTILFRTRPSMVPALISFWIFFFSTILLAIQVSSISLIAPLFALAIGVLLQLVVLYAILRNFRQAYELSNHDFTIRIKGKKTIIPLSDIWSVEKKRTFWQRVRGTSDLIIGSIVNGELKKLRLRDIAEFQRRIDQLISVTDNLEILE